MIVEFIEIVASYLGYRNSSTYSLILKSQIAYTKKRRIALTA